MGEIAKRLWPQQLTLGLYESDWRVGRSLFKVHSLAHGRMGSNPQRTIVHSTRFHSTRVAKSNAGCSRPVGVLPLQGGQQPASYLNRFFEWPGYAVTRSLRPNLIVSPARTTRTSAATPHSDNAGTEGPAPPQSRNFPRIALAVPSPFAGTSV